LKIAVEAILFLNMVVKLLVEDKVNKILTKIVFLKHLKTCVKKKEHLDLEPTPELVPDP
jgi:hypothetical protein